MSRTGQTRRFTATGDVSRTVAGELRYQGEAQLGDDGSVGFAIEGPVHLKYNLPQGVPSPAGTSPHRAVVCMDAVTRPPSLASDHPSVEPVSPTALQTTRSNLTVARRDGRRRASSPLSTRLGLLLPVSVVKERLMKKQKCGAEMREEAAVFAAAVVEYVCAELVDDGRAAAMAPDDDRRFCITADDLRIGVLNDREMFRLLGGIISPPRD
uniref:Histone H2A n=1 Tax=Plectus sambesii TaxID=2011161 RepID=A0A914V9D0_9BILA